VERKTAIALFHTLQPEWLVKYDQLDRDATVGRQVLLQEGHLSRFDVPRPAIVQNRHVHIAAREAVIRIVSGFAAEDRSRLIGVDIVIAGRHEERKRSSRAPQRLDGRPLLDGRNRRAPLDGVARVQNEIRVQHPEFLHHSLVHPGSRAARAIPDDGEMNRLTLEGPRGGA